jgi:hypothetical protein
LDSADFTRLARNQAEEGGVPGAQDSLLSVHQSICTRGENRSASRKPVKSGIWSPFRFDRNGKGSKGWIGHALKFMCVPILQAAEALPALSFRLDLANHRR